MHREDSTLEWIFLPYQQSRKLKTNVEKVSELIQKAKMRLHQLEGIDPAEIVVPFTNVEMASLWEENKHWQKAFSNFFREINSKNSANKETSGAFG